MAVSGERRSWLTARRIAVFRSSLRRSAAVSTTSSSSASRSIAPARIDSSAGTMRSRRRASTAGDSAAGRTSVARPPSKL